MNSYNKTNTTTTDSQSSKGLKAGKEITINSGKIDINSTDDSIHSNGYIIINGGQITIYSGDDGIHADNNIVINGGDINITKSYEGIGAAIGTALSLLIGNGIIINIYYHKRVKINVIKFWEEIAKMTLPFIVPIVFVIFLKEIFVLKGIASILTYGLIYTVLYCIFAYCFSMNEYEKNLLKKIRGKMHKGDFNG